MTLLSALGPVEETPIDRYLSAQADLTAVERFAQRHAADLLPRQARYYRDLIPLAQPRPGQQYGFVVELDSCTGCKACVTACHSLNGLDDDETWRTVTVLADGRQHVTAACHHCVDPACLKGCPVDAYDKDPVTGIVAHLDDQCIGCSYCTLTCPYEVPAYNPARGIVRKCDLCRDRLTEGEAPACVQACPNGAITVEVVDVAVAADVPTGAVLVPGAPSSAITRPTTVYRSGRSGDVAVAPASPEPPRTGHGVTTAHDPLVAMLVLTQLSVGALLAGLVATAGRPAPMVVVLATIALGLGMGASLLHLGRPRHFYRAVLGYRHSWLSREVLAFGAFSSLLAPYAMTVVLGHPVPVLGVAAGLAGVVAVGCSVMIYAVTRRTTWRLPAVAAQFTLTAAVTGLAAALWGSAVSGDRFASEPSALLVLAALAGASVVAARSTGRRLALGLAGGVVLPIVLAGTGAHLAGLTIVAAAAVGSELLGRRAFFARSGPPR